MLRSKDVTMGWRDVSARLKLRKAATDLVTLYASASDGQSARIEGRVIGTSGTQAFEHSDGRVANLWRTVDFLINRERKHYPVEVRLGDRQWRTTTDHEGYLRLEIDDLPPLDGGWHRVTARTAAGAGEGHLLIVPADNVHAVVTDVDDTIQVSEVTSRWRLLRHTFLHNPLQRRVVPGVQGFLAKLAARNPRPDAAPVFYLSATPRQLHSVLETFLSHHGFPRGILITKRVTDDSTREPVRDQKVYKTRKLEDLLTRLPRLRLTLLGDDGESDPEIYAEIARRFPGRIEAIWIRATGRAFDLLPGQRALNDVLDVQ